MICSINIVLYNISPVEAPGAGGQTAWRRQTHHCQLFLPDVKEQTLRLQIAVVIFGHVYAIGEKRPDEPRVLRIMVSRLLASDLKRMRSVRDPDEIVSITSFVTCRIRESCTKFLCRTVSTV